MKILRMYRRLIAIPTAVMMMFMMLPYGAAQAAMISTEQAISAPASASTRSAAEARAHVMGLLQRGDVQSEMRALGVDPAEAIERVKAMSDGEIKRVAGKLDASPAGAGHGLILGIVGAVVLVFLVLLLTDILCLTSIFDFTRCSVKGKSK